MTLEPFTINLRDEEQDRFAQIGLVFEVEDARSKARSPRLSPAIRNAILIIMTSKTSDELLTVAGKQELAEQVALATNAILDGDRPPPVRKRKADGEAGKDPRGKADDHARDDEDDRRDRRYREPYYPERVTAK
ncbi:MAG: flagellar basal body-associated FliL family protein [Burkholderiaceae bacterium]